MIGLLTGIFGVLSAIASYIEQGAVWVINALLAALAALINGIMSLLPHMSDAASLGAPTWLQWANWVYPIGALLSLLTSALTLYVAFLIVRWALRWAKAY